MSKHPRKKNLPVPPSEEEVETDEDELLGATAPMPPADNTLLDASQRRPGEDATTAGTKDEWRLMAEQIESLRAILLSLVTAVASSPAVGRQIADQLDAAGRGPAKESESAIAPATWEDAVVLGGAAAPGPSAAILGAPTATRPPDAILPAMGGERERQSETPAARACHRGHRLPQIKEFIAGGDLSAFTWRFESAFRSVNWTEDEALGALPTLLDDVSLGVFRSIPASKKKTLRDAFAEMAEFYDPPTSATRKFMSHRRGSEESPLAYRGALMALAMAAYPDATADHLDPLILSRMLKLSQELNISLPVCGHEPLTSRWVARCLDAKFNITHRDQMAAWTGKPEIDGPPLGWSPRRVVHCSDDSGDDDVLAAAVPHGIPGRRLREWGLRSPSTCGGRVIRPPADDGRVFQVLQTRLFRPRRPLPTSAFASSAEGTFISSTCCGTATTSDEQVLRAEEAPAAPPPTGPALDVTKHQQLTSSSSLLPPVHPEAKRPCAESGEGPASRTQSKSLPFR
ncbi:uncharacterized protein LOC133357125 [Lethenteron reissneri]|uniref:uncharacterized protein LOC133357125 n=1 Tax=Lethenteron reissneri TaxID=7753 RepID=UPI002AB79091|nr:uncharacterized protein LOC133357125 [Lethenteron reissneri]